MRLYDFDLGNNPPSIIKTLADADRSCAQTAVGRQARKTGCLEYKYVPDLHNFQLHDHYMANCTANVYVTNNTGSNAVITLSHKFSTDNPQIGGPWHAEPGQKLGPLQVNFETWNPGLDYWWISVTVLDGPTPGVYASKGSQASPGKECMLERADANQDLAFSVDTGTFYINLNSGGCRASLSYAPIPPQTHIKHVFLLMLENRSFDHMLGYSDITGNDASTGQNTSVIGLQGNYSNSYDGILYPTTPGADLNMPYDPGHEFPDVLEQLCGQDAQYSPNDYPAINNSGFVTNYATTKSSQEGGATGNFGEIMKCYTPVQLPVLNALARNFALCDMWFSSLPGPTWPNRFFSLAASSGGLDSSPTDEQIVEWEADGFKFQNGTLFEAVNAKAGLSGWKIYAGSFPPIAAALKGVSIIDHSSLDQLADDLASGSYTPTFTLIEPNYGDMISGTYAGGNSQHPMDSVASGEGLIKSVYEAIRSSNIWNNSLLIVTYDEHGGFYDQVAPPSAVPPGDTEVEGANTYGFTFNQYGVRVPAVLASPYIPANLIDHTVYDHSSISVILNNLFGTSLLTDRDKAANSPIKNLVKLTIPRTDCPVTLPQENPLTDNAPASLSEVQKQAISDEPMIKSGNTHGFMRILLKAELELSPDTERNAIIAAFNNLRTKGDAYQYQQKVQDMMQRAKQKPNR